jgi:hypothetical protein
MSGAVGVLQKKKSHFLLQRASEWAQRTFHENNIHAPYCLYSGGGKRISARAFLCVCRLHTILEPFSSYYGHKNLESPARYDKKLSFSLTRNFLMQFNNRQPSGFVSRKRKWKSQLW